jgi:class 3 adenylate cyclase
MHSRVSYSLHELVVPDQRLAHISRSPNTSIGNTNSLRNKGISKGSLAKLSESSSRPPSTDNAGDDIFEDETDNSSKGSEPQDPENIEKVLAHAETRQIFWLRLTLIVIVMVATALVSSAIFFRTRNAEVSEFETQFVDHAVKIIDAMEVHMQNTLGAVDNLGVSYTSYARTSESRWPYVTISEFEFRGASAKSLAGTELVSFLPLITDATRKNWESYSRDSSSWIQDSIDQQLVANGHNNVFAVTSRLSANTGGRRSHRRTQKQEINVDKQQDSLPRPPPPPTPAPQTTTIPAAPQSLPTQRPVAATPSTIPPVASPVMPPLPPTAPENGSEAISKPGGGAFAPVSSPTLSVPFPSGGNPASFSNGVSQTIYQLDASGNPVVPMETTQGTYFPIWQSTPVVPGLVNYNLKSHPSFGPEIQAVMDTQQIVIGSVLFNESSGQDPISAFITLEQNKMGNTGEPLGKFLVPVFDSYDASRRMVGILTSLFVWSDYFQGSLPFDSTGEIICVLENSCGQVISYQVVGKEATYLGEGDYHDQDYNYLQQSARFSEMIESGSGSIFRTYSGVPLNAEQCPYTLRIYPTYDMYYSYLTWRPSVYTSAVVLTFVFTSLIFILYDYLVQRRQKMVLEKAVQSHAVVSSLFPAVVRDRMFRAGATNDKNITAASAKKRLKSYLSEGKQKDSVGSAPIADLFPYTTVMFADISGFTAWSSVREPAQVFQLLETIYRAFDHAARKRKVFKVETIGDCYVAVTGLPDPQEDHAVIMTKFAHECLNKTNYLTQQLETSLGPETGDLMMRIGLHSGPVTAGVLRGEKSRFQLFGDTVNTASRMESTGKPDRIQCSQSTADLLIAAGRSHWICPRDEIVRAKGKGEVQTFWIDLKQKSNDPFAESFNNSRRTITSSARDFIGMSGRSLVWGDSSNFIELPEPVERHKHQRLIDWNSELLGKLLKQLVARRQRWDPSRLSILQPSASSFRMKGMTNPIHEVTEKIEIPQFDAKAINRMAADTETIELSATVTAQLKSYVAMIACMYQDENPFHNFEHASHVAMSANKLLSRVVAPDAVLDKNDSKNGITSDPLAQFAIVFSALIHDVDHGGVSNGQLVKENSHTATKYAEKSVAEQNSVDLAWDLLMEDEYKDLCKAIYCNQNEYQRFRSLVVNSVIATDIFDKELKEFRNRRWDKAFHQGFHDTNLRATIVIEHIIQAADVAHTMQHWHIYQKWNERLFKEMYSAFRSGRGGDNDPSEGWYKGELWFYDNYVIPLAKKLKECGVFGVASAECLTYALDNRREWERKGEEIVERMINNYGAPKWAQLSSNSVASSIY